MTVQEKNLLSRFIKKFQSIFLNLNYEEKDLEENLIKNNICNEEAIETIDKTFDSIVEDDDKHDLIYKDYSEIKAISDSQNINVEEVEEVSKPSDKNALKGHLKLLSEIIDNKFTSEENDEFVKNNPSLESICNFSRQISYDAYKEEHVENGGLEEVYTPFSLVGKQISKLIEFLPNINTKNIATLNIEYIVVLVSKYNISEENIYFITDSKIKTQFIKDFFSKVNVVEYNKLTDFIDEKNQKLSIFLKEKKIMKFDVVFMNPPYQAKSKNGGQNGGRTHIWGEFILKMIDLLNDNGGLTSINPGGYRLGGKFSKVFKEMKSNNPIYIDINSMEAAMKTFGVAQQYDIFLLTKEPYQNNTIIYDANNNKLILNINDFEILPDSNIDVIYGLIAKNGEEKVNFLQDATTYDHRRDYISKIETDVFCHPVVYSFPQKGLNLIYTKLKRKSHYGVSKIIWTNGACTQILIDNNGEYALSEFAYAICDIPENLPLIKQAMESEKFLSIAKDMRVAPYEKFNSKFMKHFRKDFWKEFI